MGASDAEHVVVAMGDATQVFEDTVRLLRGLGASVGLLKVRACGPEYTLVKKRVVCVHGPHSSIVPS